MQMLLGGRLAKSTVTRLQYEHSGVRALLDCMLPTTARATSGVSGDIYRYLDTDRHSRVGSITDAPAARSASGCQLQRGASESVSGHTMVVPLLATALLLAAPPPAPFTDCELGQRFGPAAVTFACNDAADVFECPKAESGGACTEALCGGAHSHVGCSCGDCRQRSAARAASSNFTCACVASSGCACQIAPPPLLKVLAANGPRLKTTDEAAGRRGANATVGDANSPASSLPVSGAYNRTLTFENLCATCGDGHKCGTGALLLLEEERSGNCVPLLELSPTRVATGPTGCWAVRGECADGAALVVAPCTSPTAAFQFNSSSQTVASGHCKGWCAAKAGGPPASPEIVLGNCSSPAAIGWGSQGRASRATQAVPSFTVTHGVCPYSVATWKQYNGKFDSLTECESAATAGNCSVRLTSTCSLATQFLIQL
eukprot:COSAG03_NODE_1346_length_4284_cov_516.917324_6_plen_430_part_00